MVRRSYIYLSHSLFSVAFAKIVSLYHCLIGKQEQNRKPFFSSKSKVLKLSRPQKKSSYKICDIDGVGYLTKLRLKFSMLNEHKFRHNFDSLKPFCACGNEKEDIEHFFLHYPRFYLVRQNLFGQLSDIPGLTLNLGDKSLCELLFFGDPKYNVANNRKILEATISFIKNTKRLSDIKLSIITAEAVLC